MFPKSIKCSSVAAMWPITLGDCQKQGKLKDRKFFSYFHGILALSTGLSLGMAWLFWHAATVINTGN